MKNQIELNHHVHDYECMWNGIEDLYMNQTGETLPADFFFLLAGFGSFCYRRTPKSELKRMVSLGDGRTKQMYEFLAPIVGFRFRHHVYKTFERAMAKARAEIDSGFPVVLGALDMFHLSYFEKFYHREHIPFHYVLMAGYDDGEQTVSLYDCGRREKLKLSYMDLRLAMDCSCPGLSRPNTVCTIRMESQKNKYQIAKEALAVKGDLFLNPPMPFLGYKGFERFIKELPQWKTDLFREDYDKILKNMVTFFGTVPMVPNVLRGIDLPDEVEFKGGFEKMGSMLSQMGEEYDRDDWNKAAVIFYEGADVMEQISGILIRYLSGQGDETEKLPEKFGHVLTKMKEGYRMAAEISS